MSRFQAKVAVAIALWLIPALLARAGTVTLSGTLLDSVGNPIADPNTDIIFYPQAPMLSGGNTLIGMQPIHTNPGAGGAFSLVAQGGLSGILSVPATGAVMKVLLPQSGSVNFAQILSQQPNVIERFPPTANLSMGGFELQSLSGAGASGDAVALSAGLGASTIFTSSGNYTAPTGATVIMVWVKGAGGGGGGGSTASGGFGGGGGGEGALMLCVFRPALSSTVSFTIGVGGGGGAAASAGAAGANGGQSVASATNGSVTQSCTVAGGSGGAGGTATGGGAGGIGGAGAASNITALVNVTGATALVGGASAGGAGASAGFEGGAGGASNAAGTAGAKGWAFAFAN